MLYMLNIILFITSMISFNLFLTTFFSKAKFASEIATLINVILAFSYLFVLINRGNSTKSLNPIYSYLLGLIPHYATAEGLIRISYSESGNLNKYYGTIMLLIDTVLYIFLFYYFDNIFPNQYGVRKSLCYCFKKEKHLLQGFEQVQNFDD